VIRPGETLFTIAQQRYGEGEMIWEQVLAGEVVLKWSKSSSAAPHEFKVVHLPAEGLTEAQLERIAEIEAELEREWAGARGLSSGEPSPSVGRGWDLRKESIPHTGPDAQATTKSEPADLSQVDLSKLFNGAAARRT
jgi:hypothetical protein